MRSIFILLFINLFVISFISNAQNGGASQPFTSLGQAQNVTVNGVYYFSLSGTNFSTYVRVGGWVQVAIDFRPSTGSVGNLPQSSALNNSTRGILAPNVLLTLGSATVTRALTSDGLLDVQNTRPGIVTRIVNNQTLLATPADNTDNNTNWTGTNTPAGQFISNGNTQAYGLNQNIFHAGDNGLGIHWIPYYSQFFINWNSGQIPVGAYFQLLVRAPLVAVVTGPTINTQPSTTAQSVCLNTSASALSISASSPNGSTITYQWYSNTSNSNSGGTAIGGATSASYTPPNNVVGTKYYYVICTNNQGSTTSNVSAGITINAVPQAASNSGAVIDYLVVGGGGGGGEEGGGGGGGGQVNIGSVSLLSGSFAVTIGNGGAGATTVGSQASNGGTTTLSLPTPVVSIGGGGGGSKNANGVSGANGGGGGHPGYSGGASAGGGFTGGNANSEIGGGGAGAGGVGISAPGSGGGIGVSSSISGSATFYGGGGGGGSWQTTSTSNGVGGTGGGGRGGITNTTLAQSGVANTGGGGGGSGGSSATPVAKNGGSGIVILRYLGSPSGTGGTITQVGGYTIHTFNSNGTFAFNNPSNTIVPNMSSCSAAAITFTGTVASGCTLDWYSAASGGTLLSQGTSSFTTPVLTSTTTYYVSVRNTTTGCVSATRTAVTATITASITSTTGASRCGTGTVTLQAATAAGTINWYAASTGGSSLGTGTSYTTPSISTTTTYYADVTNNGCTTSPRTAVVATVNAPPPTPTITQTGCGVLTLGNYGSGNALDLGVYNSSKYVTIPATLNSTINTNNITLEGWFYFTSSVVNTNYLPMLIGEAYNGDANITYCMHRQGDIIIAGFYNGGWQAASSSTFIPINTWIHIASTYDQNQIKLYFNGVLNSTFNSNQTLPISGNQPWYLGKRWDHLETLGGVMDEIRIWNIARTQAQIQASMNSTVPTNSAGLRAYYKLDESTGNIASDATGNGYDGTLSNGPTWQVPSTSVLGGSQATFLWSPGGQTTNTITATSSGTYSAVATSSGCQSASGSSSVVLGVTASSNQTICGGTSPANITLTGNTATIQWQSSTNNVNFTNISGATSATLTTGQMGVLNATTYYRANVTSTFCAPSTSNTVTITVNAQPTFTSTTGASICVTGTVTLQATTAAGTINWYTTLTGGSSLGTGTSYTTPSISTTTTYYADVTNNGCTSNPRTAVVATINTLPQAAANSGSVDYLVVGGGGGGGFDGAGGGGGGQVNMGSISLASGTYAVTIGNGGTNSTSYGAQASNGGSTTLSLPTPIVSIGGGGGGAKGANGATGANGGGGGHSNYAGAPGASGGFAGGNANGDGGGGGGGAGSAGATGSAGRNGGNGVSSSISGTLTYYGGGGGGGSYGNTGTGLGGIGGGGQGGLGNSPLATAGAANSGGGGGGAGEAQSNPGKNGGSGIVIVRYLGTPQGTGGTITQVGGYTIHTFNSNGSFAYNGSSSSIVPNMSSCGAAAITFTGTVVSGCTLDWYSAASGGTLLSQGTSSYTTPVLSSTTTYYVAVRNTTTGCVSATRTAVTATINTTSFTSTTGASICGVPNTLTLQATTAAGTINWYAALTGGSSLGTGTSYTTPSISTTTTYYADVTNNGCTSSPRTAVVATVNAIPTFTSTTGASICGVPNTLTLQAATAAGTINWYAALTGGSSLGTGTSYTTPSISTTTTYYANVTNNGCTSSPRTAVVATVNAIPTLTSTTGASRCGTGTVTLQATTTAGTINWYAALTGGSSLGTGTSYTTPSITTTTTYYADVSNNGCTSSPRIAVVATVNAIPTFISTSGAEICGGGNTLTLQASTAAGTINWYAALTGGTSLGTGTSYTTPSISTTTTYYADVTNNGCTSSPRTAVVAIVNPLPPIATNTLSGLTIDVLTVAGGGGAGFGRGGGGGAGGYIYSTNVSYAAGSSTAITVGTGGSPGYDNASIGVHATSGTNSSFGSTYIAVGGGGGGSYGGGPQNGYTGGSGGGGANQSSSANTGYGGTGTAGQGNAGGNSRCGGGGEVSGGGGGGAGGNGSNGTSSGCGSSAYRPYYPGNGGNGLQNSISGTAVWYAGGGGGGGLGTSTNLQGTNGLGGGQTSYGGGGQCKLISNNWATENGGPGIVIVRYAGTPAATGGTITQVGGYTIHTFTANGTFALVGVASSAVVPNMSSCGAAAITFTGTVASGCTLDWYNAASGGTLLSQGTSSYTTPVLSSTTTYYVEVRNTSTGCVSATRTAVTATVITASTASSSQTVCPGLLPSAITLTNYGGTLQWQTSSDNVTFTNIGGQTSATLPANSIGIMSGTKYIRAMVTNGSCVLPSNVVTLSPTSVSVVSVLTTTSYVWNGQSSSDWGTLSNWYSYNGSSLVPAAALPSNAHTVVIPANSTCILNQPSISSGAILITNLALETGSQLTQSGGSLLLYGNYSNNGTLNSTGGLTNFYGPSSATISGSGSIQFAKMRVNKLSGASITLQRPVTVTDSLTMVLGNINTTTTNLLTLGINSASPGKLVYSNGTIVGPFKRFFANAAVSGVAGRFPVGTATYNRYALFDFGTTPGTDQSLTVQYISGLPMQGGSALYNGLPIVASGELIQNYSGDGYWSVIPTNNNYTAPITSVNYSLTLYANNLTGMQTPQICRIIKSPGSNTVNQHHIAWQSCGTHTTIPGSAIPTAFDITSTGNQGFSWFNIGTSNNQALPVEFTKMSTTCEDELVRIQWTTESEHNNDYYRIERSNTGYEWEILGTVDGVGNSTTEQTYTYFDENQRINNYYRLYQVDIDGAQELLSTMYSECENTNSNIESFPNPSHGSFSIYWKQFKTKGEVKISILNTNGMKVLQENAILDIGVNLFTIKADLAPGLYMIELIDANNERRLIKHVVN
jgi:hypothetical protein